jgi:hypothetical protein
LVKLLKGELGSGGLIERPLSTENAREDRHPAVNAVRILVKIEPIRRSYHDREGQSLPVAQGLNISVPEIPRGLNDTSTPSTERNLVEIKLEDLSL